MTSEWTLGIDASRATAARRTGLPVYNLRAIQELRHVVPPAVRVVLYTGTAPDAELAELPPNWRVRVLRWPGRVLWNQLRLAGEMVRRPPDCLLVLHHLLPWARPRCTVALVADLGFERAPGLYGTDAELDQPARRLASRAVRALSRGRYGLSEEDYHRWTTRHAVRRARRLLVISAFTRREVEQVYGVPRERLDVAYPGVDVERFGPPVPADQQAQVLRQHGVRPPYLLYVGRLERKKNVAALIDAFARLQRRLAPPHQLVLAGTPVVCADLPVLREAAGGAAVFCDQRAPEAIAQALEMVLTDAALRCRLIAAGRARCRDFTWQRCAAAIWSSVQQAHAER